MNFIKPTVEIWDQDNLWDHIARCTRVCYQSVSDKSKNEDSESWVRRIVFTTIPLKSEANHLAVLEHGTIYLTWPVDIHDTMTKNFQNNKYSKVVIIEQNSEKVAYITTNLRVLVENDWLDLLQYECEPTWHHHRVTVCFNTNIGVSREFNRHRVNSICEESTRYCNYNRKNDGQINYCLPEWLYTNPDIQYITNHQHDELSSYCEDVLANGNLIDNWCDIDYYLFSLTVSEFCYNALVKKGWTAQKAREVLPLATKTQLIHTAFIDDWKHFFKLRAKGVSGNPHPNAKILAGPLYEAFLKRDYIQEL